MMESPQDSKNLVCVLLSGVPIKQISLSSILTTHFFVSGLFSQKVIFLKYFLSPCVYRAIKKS